MTAGPPPAPAVAGVLLACVIAWAIPPSGVHGQTPPAPPLTVKITSPLGRTGATGSVRIVAQIKATVETPFPIVRFYVDGVLLKTDDDGPPYAAEWADTDLLTQREIAVDATDAAGNTAKDTIVLKPVAVDDSTDVTSVLVEASVYTKTGRFVSGLGTSDFAVSENGVPQKVDVASVDAVPATFALLIDSSQSMAPRMDFVRLAATRIGPYLRPLDKVIIAPFTKQLGTITGPTNDQSTVLEAIKSIHAGGGTAILDAIVELSERLSTLEGRRAIVLLTDGFDENSTHTIDAAIRALQDSRTTLYIVAVGGISGVSLKGQALFQRLAKETGGRTFFPWREQDLATEYDFLAVDAQNRYVIIYTPTNQVPDGAWRQVTVTTRSDDVVQQTKRGYFAPEPVPIVPEIEFTLTDSQQRYVDVAAEDLQVFEDGVEQQVRSFREAVAPVSIVLALDASGSMRRSVQAVIDAARGFVDALRPKDALALLMFADVAVFSHDFVVDRQTSYDAIDQYTALGGTALYDGLFNSAARLKKTDGRRAVVVVTDGRDEDNPGKGPGSTHTFDEVLEALKGSGVIVYSVGIGANVDRERLEKVALISGGHAYFPADMTALSGDYSRIVENLRRRFVLSYSSTNKKRDGTFRKVEIRSKLPNVNVSTVGGYFAPAK